MHIIIPLLIVVVLLISIVFVSAKVQFKQRIKRERAELLKTSIKLDNNHISTSDIENLPEAVQKWLSVGGVLGKRKVSSIYLTQELELKLKPEQTNWNKGTAEQYFSVNPPAFNWASNIQMNPLMNVVGRDKFNKGKGQMLIKLLSLIPVANAKNDQKIDQATLQRYLAEIVWFPSAALSSTISWEAIDNRSAKATMEYQGTIGSGIFHFTKDGQFEKFIALRYKDSKDDAPTEWTVTAIKTEERNGVQIPTRCEASWKLKDKQWIWLKLTVKTIEYDLPEMKK